MILPFLCRRHRRSHRRLCLCFFRLDYGRFFLDRASHSLFYRVVTLRGPEAVSPRPRVEHERSFLLTPQRLASRHPGLRKLFHHRRPLRPLRPLRGRHCRRRLRQRLLPPRHRRRPRERSLLPDRPRVRSPQRPLPSRRTDSLDLDAVARVCHGEDVIVSLPQWPVHNAKLVQYIAPWNSLHHHNNLLRPP